MVTNFRANPAYRRKIDTHNDYARRAKLEDNLAFRGVRGIPKLVDSRISPMRFFHPVTNMNIEVIFFGICEETSMDKGFDNFFKGGGVE